MDSIRQLCSRLAGLFRRRNLEAEMAEEMRQHLERRIQEKIVDGLSPDEARYAAQREFGGVAQVQEQCRDERRFVWLEQVSQDVSFALRTLRKSPGFIAVAVFSLAIGIGACTAIFTLVNEVLLRPLPVKNPGELVLFRNINGARGSMARASEGNGFNDPVTGRYTTTSFSLLSFENFRAQRTTLSEVFAFAPFDGLNVLVDGQPEIDVAGQLVSGTYYTGLGVSAVLGRVLTPEDDQPAAPSVAVISHRYWENRFGRDSGVVGRTLQINQIPTTIIGVTPPGFDGTLQIGESPDITVPLAQNLRYRPGNRGRAQAAYWWVRIMGRLAPNVTAAQARASLEPVFHSSAREGWLAGQSADAASTAMPDVPSLAADAGGQGENDTRREHAKSLRVLLGLASLVLLAACANVANLLLARATARRREIALRLALGASRARIIRQLLTESLLLAAVGATLGTLLAQWSRGLLMALRPFGNAAAVLDLSLDGRVLAFATIVAFATALLFGLAPALRATRVNLVAEFQGGARTLGGGRAWLGRTLAILQIALSLVLLVSTGLFVRTLRNLENVDSGFNRRQLALFQIDPRPVGYTSETIPALQARILERMATLPGVRAATFSSQPLLSSSRNTRNTFAQGVTLPPGVANSTYVNLLAPDFFTVMGLPLVAGRAFDARDNASAPKVAVVNQTFARKYFGNENPIGRRVGFERAAASGEIEIIGVARDASYTALRAAIPPTIYIPILQQPNFTAHFAVRTVGDPAATFSAIRTAVQEINPTLPVLNLRTQDEQLDRLHAQELLFARLSGFFGIIALIIASLGLYGLMSYAVLRRTGEIGLRMALGAAPQQVLGMILRESLTLVGFGVAVGCVAAWTASRLVASMLFGLSATDPATYGTVALLLITVALIAAMLPARRAAKTNPMIALRAQ